MRQQISSTPRFLRSLLFTLLMVLMVSSISVAQDMTYNEAPSLAERVAAGELPPVEERLPTNPLVVQPYESVGEYGGTWNTALLGASDYNWLRLTIGYAHLVRWNPEWTEVIPDIAESFEYNDDSTEFTFRLREGMKWSDGAPFTANDIAFWYEDVALNEELSPNGPESYMTSGGEPAELEVVDDYTFVLRFAAPNGMLLQRLATNPGALPVIYPRHYLEQFHPTYNPDGIEALVQQAGAADWMELFNTQAGLTQRWSNPELPTLNPWMIVEGIGTGTQVVAERNPYFYKVDPEGNQLPYIDRVVYDIVEDVEVMVLKAINGEIDMQDRHIGTATNLPVLFDNQESGNYRIFESVPAWSNTMLINLNLTHQNPVKREVFNNKDFRLGLSHAIDRQEIIDLIHIGEGEPWQAAPRADTAFYDEEMAKQYTEYDVDLANQYLDQAGYAERDAEGFRLGPDGNRISIIIEVDTGNQEHVDTLELIERYWEAVGIDTEVRALERGLLGENLDGNNFDASTFVGGGGLDQLTILDPKWYFPQNAGARYAVPWGLWYLNAEDPAAEEPIDAAKQQMELYDQLQSTANPDEQAEYMRQILEIAKEQFYTIGISLQPSRFGIVSNNMQNVPDSMPQTFFYLNPGPTNPEQYYFVGGQG